MGLESIYLKGSETSELVYRLSMRIAKAVNIFYSDPIITIKEIKVAYDIRSTFVHGAHFPENKLKKKLDKLNIDKASFLKKILNYLRISLVMLVMLKYPKEKFIELIDNSLVDESSNRELLGYLIKVKDIISSPTSRL